MEISDTSPASPRFFHPPLQGNFGIRKTLEANRTLRRDYQPSIDKRESCLNLDSLKA